MAIEGFLEQLRSKAAAVPADVLLKKMGYRKPGAAARDRLSKVLADPDLGLEQGGYDFRYDSKAFVSALCLAVGIANKDAQSAIATITAELAEDAAAFKPYLFVDTAFRRRNEPLVAMAVLESNRYVPLPQRFWRLPLEKQLVQVSEEVRQHMARTAGKLLLWGGIQRYFYFFAEGHAMEIAVDGEVLGEREDIVPSRVVLEEGVVTLLKR